MNSSEKIIAEFIWLWKEYVLTPDEDLSEDALELKKKLIRTAVGLRDDLTD